MLFALQLCPLTCILSLPTDRKIRTQALDSLKAFLTAKYAAASATATPAAALAFDDAQKVWAGLFYALWMADRAPAQQRLCDELAGLPRAVGLPDAAIAAWLRAFWATMARQWTTGIDVLRMDKFLLLVRRVLGAQLVWMAGDLEKKADVPSSEAERLGLGILANWPFNADAEALLDETSPSSSIGSSDERGKGDSKNGEEKDIETAAERPRKRSRKSVRRSAGDVQPTVHIPVGLTLHVVDIWVDEAEKAGLLKQGKTSSEAPREDQEDATGASETLTQRINAMVTTLAAKTMAPAVRKRAREALEDERLPWNLTEAATAPDTAAAAGETDGPNEKGSWDGFDD